MTTDLLHATIAFMADTLAPGSYQGRVARAVLTATGVYEPTQAGVDALCALMDSVSYCEKLVNA